MQYNLAFNIPTYTDDDSTFPKPDIGNYDYWTALLEHFLTSSNTIEIHCWNEEIETISEIKSLYKNELGIVKEGNLTILSGQIHSTLSDYLLNNYLNKIGEFKWFTVNLVKDMVSVFHSGHWGKEFFVPNVLKRDVAFIMSVIPDETVFIKVNNSLFN